MDIPSRTSHTMLDPPQDRAMVLEDKSHIEVAAKYGNLER